MIKKVPTYEEKDQLSKNTFLTKQVNLIIKTKVLVKYCATILVQIADSFVERALLNLRVGVNLLLYFIYKKLGLEELKATAITLSFVDCSIKEPKGVVKDVLVQVDKLHYPVDFVVSDTKLVRNYVNSILVILGRPFLTTTNALVNCCNELMQLSFGNIIVEMNVFNLCKQPMDHNDVENEQVCPIEALVQKHTKNLMDDKIKKFFTTMIKGEKVEIATMIKGENMEIATK